MFFSSPVRSSLLTILLTLSGVLAYPGRAAAGTLSVCSSGCTFSDLQAALDAAQPGDTILLRAGETFVGHFVLPAKGTAGPAITIKSDAPATSLPAPGVRLVPHGYPGGNTALAALARLRGRGGIWRTTPVLQAAPGAHHYRLQFLDIDGVAQEGWETLVEIGTSAASQSTMDAMPAGIVLDRVFVHGHAVKGQKRCIALNGRDLEVSNSYVISCASIDFDAQAIGAFNGPGPYRIVNNHLEGTGENIIFGGADPRMHGMVPSDVEIRRNYIVKPLTWRDPILSTPSAPTASVVGGGSVSAGTYYFTVVAVVVSASEPAYSAGSPERAVAVSAGGAAVALSWNAVPGADHYRVYVGTAPGGQNRYIETSGAATSLTYRGTDEVWNSPPAQPTRWNVKNLLELKNAQRVLIDGNVFEHLWPASQQGYAILFTPRNEEGGAPWSVVRDVTFSNNVLRHVSGGINILGEDDVRQSERTGRITIRNNLVYDISTAWGGAAHFLVITRSPYDVKVDHNTIFHDGMVVIGDDGASPGFQFTNNLAPHNTYGIFGSGAGTGTSALAVYFPDAVVRRNALGGGPAALYPPDNFFPDLPTFMAQFVNPSAFDYRLVAGSIFRGVATDGRDLGVDFGELDAAQQGVDRGGTGGPGGGETGGGGGGTDGGGSDGGGTGGGDGGGSPTPFSGTALLLPGVIQGEDFDHGANGVAYADASVGNTGGHYRNTDVDLEVTADADEGYNVGWMAPGEWLGYTVNVATAGAYTVEIRVAAAGPGGTFHIEVDGVDKTGPVTIPNTGGWQAWTTVSRSLTLTAGVQRWRFVIDAAGPGGVFGNLNYLRVSSPPAGGGGASSPFGGTAASLPGTLQAEDFDAGGQGVGYVDNTAGNAGGHYRSGDVDIAPAEDAGGGYTIGWISAGEWLKYTVNVAAAGSYDVEVRVASAGAGGTFHIEVDGVDRTGPIAVPDTGSWQTWTTVRRTGVTLQAGLQVWRVVMASNGPAMGAVGNLNYFSVVNSAAAPPPAGAGSDVVLYAADVSRMAGNWSRVGSWSGAGAEKMQSADWGWDSASRPLAAPADYVEWTFTAEAGRAYRVWLRLRAADDSKWNDSVWVQFSGAANSSGSPLWRTGSTEALLVNLERCGDCGLSGWGWQSGAWWLGDQSIVHFPAGGLQTMRVQTREDGVEIDQIVLSPATYFTVAPGAAVDDATIVPKR